MEVNVLEVISSVRNILQNISDLSYTNGDDDEVSFQCLLAAGDLSILEDAVEVLITERRPDYYLSNPEVVEI